MLRQNYSTAAMLAQIIQHEYTDKVSRIARQAA
jgi:hypothetical protein